MGECEPVCPGDLFFFLFFQNSFDPTAQCNINCFVEGQHSSVLSLGKIKRSSVAEGEKGWSRDTERHTQAKTERQRQRWSKTERDRETKREIHR